MNEFQREIYKTIDILTEQKLKSLGFDKTKRGKVSSVNGAKCTVRIDEEEYTCKLRRGIYVEPNDIVFVKFPQNNDVDKYVDTILGENETPDYLVISAEEILEKLKTVDGSGSGLDADTLDGKHASEFATVDDIGDIDISGDTIIQNINSSSAIIDNKNLSENVNDAIDKKHEHSNKSIIDTITQVLIDGWNSAVTHISDTVKHITSSERVLWNTVSNKSDLNHTHIETDITDLDKYTKTETDNKLSVKADKSYVDTELNKKLDSSLKGITNGLAELDDNGKVPSSQLPSYVDDVLEYSSKLDFPITGEGGKIYIAIDTNKTYRWSGTNYAPISSDLALGETSSTAYRGDRGKIAYDHSQTIHDKILIGLENVDNVKQATKIEFDNHNNNSEKHITSLERNKWNLVDNKVDKIAGKQLSTEDYTNAEKSKLAGIESDANNYSLPIASNQILGGIKIGANLSIAQDGTLSALSGDERVSFRVQQETFVADEGQTLFNLTKGEYQPNTNTISVYIYGGKQPNVSFTELNTTSLELSEPLKNGTVVIVEYIEISSATPYPMHGDNHLTDGYDPIPKVTTSSDGLMTKEDKTKLNGIEHGANKYIHPSTHSLDIITETSTKKILTVDERDKIAEIDNKVDKITGKGLSTEDYTTTEKNKLAGISAGAEVNQNTFSNIKVGTSTISADNKTDTIELIAGTGISLTPDIVNDKLTISGVNQYVHPETHPANMIVESSTKQFVSDSEKSTWNSKWDYDESTIKAVKVDNSSNADTVNGKTVAENVPAGAKFTDTVTTINGKTGVIFKADIVALGIPAQDTVYSHPNSHPASMITEDQTRMFVSDAEKNIWNNKAEVLQIPTKVSELVNDVNYVTQDDLGAAGFGDMVKGVYDTNNNGIVDNAEKVNGFTVESNVPANAKFTDTIYTHPSTHPASMITGLHNVATSGIADKLSIVDTRSIDNPPNYYFSQGKNMFWEFKSRSSVGNPPINASASGIYAFILTITGWGDSSGGYPVQISAGGSNLAIRQGVSTTAWGSWYVIANIEDLPTKLSQLIKDINFDERYYTETESDTKYEPKNTNIQSHIFNTSNPHNTTKSHVGLGNILNYGISTQLEAEAGTSNVKYMTPLRTKQAIDKAMSNVSSGTEVVVSNTDPNNNSVHWIDTSI